VGFGTPVPLLVGIVLILLGIGLFFLDNFKPGYKRDSDTVYAVLLLTVGILSLLIWNAGFAEALQLMVSAGTLIALMIERIQNRAANNDSMRSMGGGRAPSRRDGDRPSRAYRGGYDDNPRDLRVELDDDLVPSIDDSAWSRRIPGAREERTNSRNSYSQTAYLDQLSDESRPPRRSSATSRSFDYEDEKPYGEERLRRRPLQLGGDNVDSPPAETDDTSNGYSNSNRRRRPSGNRRPVEERASTDLSIEEPPRSNRRRRVRPENSRSESSDGDYVDYKPLNPLGYPDQEMDNSSNFDDPPEYK
jgi:Ycf66 protein N-terminus